MRIPIVSTIKDVINYSYTIKCFKMIMDDKDMAAVYKFMTLSPLGVLYFPIKINGKVSVEYHQSDIASKLTMIDGVMTEQNLMGLIEVKTADGGEREDGSHIYFVKIIPIIFNILASHLFYDIVLIVFPIFAWRPLYEFLLTLT